MQSRYRQKKKTRERGLTQGKKAVMMLIREPKIIIPPHSDIRIIQSVHPGPYPSNAVRRCSNEENHGIRVEEEGKGKEKSKSIRVECREFGISTLGPPSV